MKVLTSEQLIKKCGVKWSSNRSRYIHNLQVTVIKLQKKRKKK